MRYWVEMTWEEIDKLDRENILLILPLGSTEQHGQRLPVGTDAFFANYWAKRIAAEIPNSVLLPSLSYGMSEYHTGFPGTVSISPSTYEQILYEIIKSVARHGFRKILIVNGHGGNHKWIENAITRVENEYSDIFISNPVMSLFNYQDLERLRHEFGEHFVHAGAIEVSQFAAISPKKIRPESVVTDFPIGAKSYEGTESPEAWKEKFPKGQKGDQVSKIDFKKGKRLNKYVVAKLIKRAKQMMD